MPSSWLKPSSSWTSPAPGPSRSVATWPGLNARQPPRRHHHRLPSVVFTCKFSDAITQVDLQQRKILATGRFGQNFNRADSLASVAVGVRASGFTTNGRADRVTVTNTTSFKPSGFIMADDDAHGLFFSRESKLLCVTHRGRNCVSGKTRGEGNDSLIDFATGQVLKI